MKGLLIRAFLNFKKPFNIILILLLTAFGISIVFLMLMNKDAYQEPSEMEYSNWLSAGIISFCISALSMSCYMDDYFTKWDIYCKILPITLRTRTASGFIFASIVNLASALLSSTEIIVFYIVKNCFSIENYIFGITTIFCIVQLIISIYLIFTMIFKKYSVYALCAAFFITSIFIATFSLDIEQTVRAISEYLIGKNLITVSLAELAAASSVMILIYFLTVFISSNIHKWVRALKKC